MSKNTWKLVVAAVLASSGLVAFVACGGGNEEGNGAQTPSASETATAPASETASATATATATATTPPAPTLPDSFKAADDARKTADGKLAELVAKKNTCPAAASDLTKFTKDNGAAYQTWNAEYSKLDDAQKGLVQTKPLATLNDEMAMFDSGSFKPCIAKKDKKVGMALAGFLSAASKGLPGAAAPAGSASAAPSGSAKSPAKK